MIRYLALAAVALAIGTPSTASTVVNVPATGDLYLAGQPAGTACCFNDSSPAESPTLAPIALSSGEYLTFTTTGSATNQPGPVYATADGNTASTYDLNADYGTGISGPNNIHLAGLAGVFIGDNVPTGNAPAQLSGTDYALLSPGLGQMFFIGDGLTGTGSGSVQDFFVPNGATRLFLGVADNGGYYDNSGQITAMITSNVISAAPEPGTWVLMFAGVIILGAMLRYGRRHQVGSLLASE